MFRYLWVLALIVITSSAQAETVVDWAVSPDDTSYQYLSYLFGHMSNDLVCYIDGCSQVIPLVFQAFNDGVLVLATLLLGYISLVSTGNSAQQGEFLGRRFSSLWTPAKLVGGMSFIVPTSSGYCLLQIGIMKVTLLGVALANNLFGVIKNYVDTNNTSFALESQNTRLSDQYGELTSFVSDVYTHELCYAYYQQSAALYQINPTEAQNLGISGDSETFYTGPQEFGCSGRLWGYDYNSDEATITVNCSASQPLSPPSPDTCGYWFYTFSSNDPDPTMTQETLNMLVQQARATAEQDATFYLYSGGVMDSYLTGSTITTTQQQMAQTQGIASVEQLSYAIAIASSQLISQSLGTVTSDDVSYGGADWLDFLKNFYSWLNKSGSAGRVDFIGQTQSIVGAADSSAGSQGNQTAYNAMKSSIKNQDYFNANTVKSIVGDDNSDIIDIKEPPGSGNTSFDTAANMAYNVFTEMLAEGRDPLIALAVFGQKLLQQSFDILFSALVLSAALMIVTAICSSKQSSFAVGITTALGMFIINVVLIFGFLIPVGTLLGIYLPIMPMMVYSLGALHWLISVIEAVVAGPIIALGFMAPTQQQDFLGKASPAVLIMLQVFIRPGGMVLGMVFAAKLFDVIAPYFTQCFLYGLAFMETLMTGTTAIRACIFIIYFFFYCFVIVGIANRCYSLVNALPDRVIAWIGGPVGQVSREVDEDLGLYRQAVDRSGQELNSQMSNLAKGLGGSMSMLNEAIAKNKENQQGGGGPPGGGAADNPGDNAANVTGNAGNNDQNNNNAGNPPPGGPAGPPGAPPPQAPPPDNNNNDGRGEGDRNVGGVDIAGVQAGGGDNNNNNAQENNRNNDNNDPPQNRE